MELFVGIDVAKATFEIKESTAPPPCSALRRTRHTTYSEPNTPAGIRRIARRMVDIQPILVVMEATGGLEKALARALAAASIRVAIINPPQ
jgi:transposase